MGMPFDELLNSANLWTPVCILLMTEIFNESPIDMNGPVVLACSEEDNPFNSQTVEEHNPEIPWPFVIVPAKLLNVGGVHP
jgi:hypothetical protein